MPMCACGIPRRAGPFARPTQHQAVDYTPLEGFEAHGRAKAVYVNGVWWRATAEPTEPAGRYVPR